MEETRSGRKEGKEQGQTPLMPLWGEALLPPANHLAEVPTSSQRDAATAHPVRTDVLGLDGGPEAGFSQKGGRETKVSGWNNIYATF